MSSVSGYAFEDLAGAHATRRVTSLPTITAGRLSVAFLPFLALAILTPHQAVAQSEDEVVPELWLDYNPSIAVSERVDLFGDMGYRTQLESSGWHRLVIRPNVRYAASDKVVVQGGLGSFFTWNEDEANRWELRPWQGVSAAWPRLPFQLQHVLRLEERFEFNTGTWDSWNSLRLRYRIRASHQWGAWLRRDRTWRLLLSAELFARLAGQEGQAQEQIRLVAGLERGIGPAWRARVEATWQKAGRFFAEGSFNELFVRLRAFHDWSP